MFLDFIFLLIILIFQESYLAPGHSIKYVIIILTSFFGVMTFSLFCIQKTIISKILMYIYEIGSGIYLIISIFFQIKEIKTKNERYRKEYREKKFNYFVLGLSFGTIILKLFAYIYLKDYIEMIDKKECFIRDNLHEEFLEELEKNFEENILEVNYNDLNSDAETENDIIDIYSKVKKRKK